MSREKSEIEKTYEKLIETLKKQNDVLNRHVAIDEERIEILERRVSARDELIKVYEQAMQGTKVSGTAIDLLNKVNEEHTTS